jgi:putative MFS transporter
MLVMICMNVVVYTFTGWLPTMLVTNGVPLERSLLFTTLMQVGSLPGAPLGAWVVDRFGRKFGIVLMSLAASATSVFVALTAQSFLLVGSGFAFFVVLYALVAATFAIYVPELFPTRVRMTGSSISNASGRIANIVVPHGVARLLTSFGSSAVYFSIAGVLLLQAIVMASLAEETRCKSLEEIGERI